MACSSAPDAPPPTVSGAAEGVAAADLDGDGADEPILISGGVARWPGGQVDLGGAIQAIARAPADPEGGDRREALLLGTGSSRDQPDAPARLWRLAAGPDGAVSAETLWERKGLRNQVTEIRVLDGAIWLAAFADRMNVEGGWLEDGALQPLVRDGLATRQLPVDRDRAAVGRVYGDRPKSDGDLRLMGRGATPATLPTLRGVRSLAGADLDGDGDLELLVGDGWHYAYAAQGVARVLLLEGPGWTTGRTIALFDGEYSARQIEPAGDDLLVTGTGAVHLLRRDAMGWADHRLAEISETDNAVFLQGPWGGAALISGDPARVVTFP